MIITGVKCDKCGDSIIWNQHLPKWLVIRWARGEGWSIGKQTLCPRCRKRKPEGSETP